MSVIYLDKKQASIVKKQLSWEKTQALKIKEALKALGTSPNKIAKTLENKKILGKPDNVFECPVANYLQKVFKNMQNLRVYADEIEVTFAKGTIHVIPPKAVTNFIGNFDACLYKALIHTRIPRI